MVKGQITKLTFNLCMDPKFQKPLLALSIVLITVGYFVGSWYLITYGEKQGNIKLMVAPLVGFIALYIGINITFAIKGIICPQRDHFSPMQTQYY
jgi:hypothetical protein